MTYKLHLLLHHHLLPFPFTLQLHEPMNRASTQPSLSDLGAFAISSLSLDPSSPTDQRMAFLGYFQFQLECDLLREDFLDHPLKSIIFLFSQHSVFFLHTIFHICNFLLMSLFLPQQTVNTLRQKTSFLVPICTKSLYNAWQKVGEQRKKSKLSNIFHQIYSLPARIPPLLPNSYNLSFYF